MTQEKIKETSRVQWVASKFREIHLSEAEEAVFDLLILGYNDSEIAALRGVSNDCIRVQYSDVVNKIVDYTNINPLMTVRLRSLIRVIVLLGYYIYKARYERDLIKSRIDGLNSSLPASILQFKL